MGKNVGPEDVCPKCESPLFPAIRQTIKNFGKRTIERFNKEWPVKFYTAWPHAEVNTGTTKNVSLNRMQLITETELEINQVLKITSNELFAVAKVVNYQQIDHEWRYGLEYITLRFHRVHGTFISLEI